ncbi:MAG TPA: membrane protein insertase YidC [Bradyrhizobium sp.]|nr:membrane protein insertase YidC [Bradyrhizobium sp.]
MNDQKNMILAIVLSALVLLAWQYFVGLPQMEKQRQIAQQQQGQQPQGAPESRPPAPGGTPQLPGPPSAAPQAQLSREDALAKSKRIAIDTPRLSGSIALTGARIDDLSLIQYRETVDPRSPAIVLLSPSGSPHPYYAEFGWLKSTGDTRVPGSDTVWTQEGSGGLGVGHPVTLVWDNGEGLIFRRTIAVDDKYLFTVKDEVTNKGEATVALNPFALISRHGTPPTLGYYILHEGLIGVIGDQGLKEITYKDVEKKNEEFSNVKNAWLGFTDKYWAAALLPQNSAQLLKAKFSAETLGTIKTYQTDYLLDAQTVPPGSTSTALGRLFAGAKEVAVIDGYEKQLNLNRFEQLIDWGLFYFVTKPMFKLIDLIFHWVGNFGVAILIVTVLVKIAFFPLANKSYASMAKMKAVQPQMQMIRERYGDDKVKQQQAMMELYKKEKINPVAGCLPMVIQIPVFFALYKVLFITIEMRHAPFFGWIKDLSAPDPTSVFNLFGLLPFDPSHAPLVGQFLMIGAWPLVMGMTMWVQMKLNPAPPDPTQKMIFDWMPIIFTFMLANFSAGLVIYWAWNNFLSVIQQSVIMRKNGAKIELFDNIKALFAKSGVKNQ